MIFTSFTYLYFFLIVFVLYWLVAKRPIQNLLLLISSYIFYGWVHPWFCILIAVTTIIDFYCGIAIREREQYKKLFLLISVVTNLGMLGFFKYFNFFIDNVIEILKLFGLNPGINIVKIFLPVGISFYTFQSLSYVIDIYRNKMEPSRNIVDFASFVILFPQLVAGPIERARNLIPQLQKDRKFSWLYFEEAIPLLITGYLKKLVIADSIAVYADYIFMYEHPPFFMLFTGTVAFALQILADFSAYTDIARGSAKLLGFNLMENFNNPYMAISPSDFWRRWHISFSSFIKEYLYISLGGSRVKTKWHFLGVVLITMGLSGLWHGAAWNFVLWGIFHGLLVFVYHLVGKGGYWKPVGIFNTFLSWALMMLFTLAGWLLFRAPDIAWLISTLKNLTFTIPTPEMKASLHEVWLYIVIYSLPLGLITVMNKYFPQKRSLHYAIYGIFLALIFIFFSEQGQDFIYFQF